MDKISQNVFSIAAIDIHDNNVKVGWWKDSVTYGGDVADKYFVATKLCLSHSEISEGMEGLRKNLADDKLPHWPMLAVEIADAIIRLLDIAGYFGWPIGQIMAEKMAYNAIRKDHQLEVRNADGGKGI